MAPRKKDPGPPAAPPKKPRKPRSTPPKRIPPASVKEWRAKKNAELQAGADSPWKSFRGLFAPNLKFTEAAKVAYLAHLAENGRFAHAAAAVGVSTSTVLKARKEDPDFDAACAEAFRRYGDSMVTFVQKMAREGMVTERKVLVNEDGEEDGEIIKRAFFPAIVQMEARRAEPAYREKSEVDLNVSGGVLVAPAPMSMDEWDNFAAANPPPLPRLDK